VSRQPLEDRTVTISRAQGSLTFPANFMLVGAQNPCPCSYYGDAEHACTYSPLLISCDQKRLAGPLLDRIDIPVDVPRVPFQKLSDERRGEPSAGIRARLRYATTARWTRPAGTPKVLGAAIQRPMAGDEPERAGVHWHLRASASVTGCSSWRGRSRILGGANASSPLISRSRSILGRPRRLGQWRW
jgi:predicted ATPase with chaperone activity